MQHAESEMRPGRTDSDQVRQICARHGEAYLWRFPAAESRRNMVGHGAVYTLLIPHSRDTAADIAAIVAIEKGWWWLDSIQED